MEPAEVVGAGVVRTGVAAVVALAVAGAELVGAEAGAAVVDVVVVVGGGLEDTTLPGIHWLHAGPDQSITPWSPQAGGRGLPVTSTMSPTRLKS